MSVTLSRRHQVVVFVTANAADFTPGQVAEACGVTLRTVNDCIRHGLLEVNSDGCMVPSPDYIVDLARARGRGTAVSGRNHEPKI